MLFELNGADGSALNPQLASAYESWLKREPALALKEIRTKREILREERVAGRLNAIDWIFAVDVFSVCAWYDSAQLLGKIGVREHPEDPHLLITSIWELALHGKLFDCQEQIEAASKSLPKEYVPVLKALEAYNFSVSGWRTSGTRSHQEALECGQGSALSQYILSRAASYRSAWPESIETGKRALELSPGWVRARSTLSDALLAQGRAEEALELLAAIPPDATPFFSFGLSKAIAFEAVRKPDEAIRCLENLLTTWPLRSRYQRFAARHLALLQLTEGKDQDAERTIEEYGVRAFPIDRKSEGNKRVISLPLVSQAHNHCVPTVAAMVSTAQGETADPLQFAREMKTGHGTPLWRMVDHMEERGFRAYCVKPNIESVKYFIDLNVPLIGVLNGLFSSHVDVINGYDTTLGVVHIRDPMHWYGRPFDLESLEARYRDSEGLWALVHGTNLEVPSELLEPVGEAFVDLTRAAAKGKREVAEQAFFKIPDDHPLIFARDSISRFIVLNDTEYEKRLDAYVDWEQPIDKGDLQLEHLHAILAQISNANADRVIKLVDESEERFGERFAEYIRCQCLVAKLEWQEAHERLSKLSRQIPQVESMWRLFSVVEEQLGNADAAELYLEHALDIAPDDASLNRQWLDLHADSMTCQQQFERIARLAEENPDSHEARWTKTHALMNLGDGEAFEKSILESIRYWPRYQTGYETLADWYLMQGRLDLAQNVLHDGRELVGEELIPLRPFEQPEAEAGEESNEPVQDSESEKLRNEQRSRSSAPNDSSKGDDGFDSDFRELLEATEELSSEETLAADGAKDLLRRDAAKELRWWQSVRFRSYLVFKVIREPVDTPERKARLLQSLQELLPAQVPGVAELYVLSLLRDLGEFGLRNEYAKVVLEWSDRVCANAERYPGLLFEKAVLLEQIGQFNDAERLLDSIIEKYPAYAGAWYRLGQVAGTRGDYERAIECYRQCLVAAPANEGALGQLASLYNYLEDPKEPEPRLALIKLRPYSRGNTFDYAAYLARTRSLQEGIRYLEGREDSLAKEDLKLLKARLFVDFEQVSIAESIVTRIEQVEERNQEIFDWLRIDCNMLNGDYQAAIEVLEEYCERNKEDEGGIEQLARLYREVDPKRAYQYADEKLRAGVPVSILAYIVCQQSDKPSKAGIEIVQANKLEDRDGVALTFSEALNQPQFLQESITYLDWCASERKHQTTLRESLAYQLATAGNGKRAVEVAEKLLEDEPNNPRWLKLAGTCMQEVDPKKSLSYLAKELEMTGSSDTLVRMARAHQLARDPVNAITNYKKALELNPFETLAITNLVCAHQHFTPKLFEQACLAIRHGYGDRDQYFLVTAVMLAIRFKGQLPEEWYPQAIRRYRDVLAGDGYGDEQDKLRAAIITWAKTIKDQKTLEEHSNFWERWFVGWKWPGKKWIPESLT